ncbi:YitT family protein [Domibacillus sp. DTU_2020_1001157_1_SI_ALB_TIR_016]|uniref:YitT family protein n=1 Tax=Domibacillus sp. DTU_2020_1001157_1_SI_ALB_TIR_016 TaxID=3077789 RepID=UPI0028EBF91A|nr:YitT family protein [Domibacillus sp. DTU_2020_1001157_1_SI_ALB_TIR_016]WNS81604.1 YitT family protein [Domibacillus sp. DTU_2020_1001157_1_SI_ALB_TIR_016]
MTFRALVRKYFLVSVGAVMQGFAMGVFLFPNFIPSGGGAGLTVLLNYWLDIPISIALWLVNSSMLLFAVHYLGGMSALGTLLGITITSISVNIFNVYVESPFSNVWMDLFFGSLFFGTGVSILLRQGVSNGGVGVIALIIAKYRRVNPSKPLFWINGFIFLITAYAIAWEIVVQALICQWMSTRTIGWLYTVPRPKNILTFDFIWRKK